MKKKKVFVGLSVLCLVLSACLVAYANSAEEMLAEALNRKAAAESAHTQVDSATWLAYEAITSAIVEQGKVPQANRDCPAWYAACGYLESAMVCNGFGVYCHDDAVVNFGNGETNLANGTQWFTYPPPKDDAVAHDFFEDARDYYAAAFSGTTTSGFTGSYRYYGDAKNWASIAGLEFMLLQ